MVKVSLGAIVDKPGSSKSKKTGSWRSVKPVITDKCIGCGICINTCPEFAIKIIDSKGKKMAKIDYDYCKGCLICMKVCPTKAVKEEE